MLGREIVQLKGMMKEEKIKVQRLQRKMKDQYKDMQGRLEVVWIFIF